MEGISIPDLSEAEALYIVSVLNGIDCTESTLVANLTWPLVPQAPGWECINKEAFDGPALLAKLDNWTPAQRIRLLDAVDEFWSIDYVPDIRARLQEVEMIKETSQ